MAMDAEKRFELHNKGIDALEQLAQDRSARRFDDEMEFSHRIREARRAEARRQARASWDALEATRKRLGGES